MACVADEDAVTGHAQWRHFEMQEKLDEQSGQDPGASFVSDCGMPVSSARVAVDCNRVVELESTTEKERANAAVAKKAKEKDLDAWEQFKVS